MIQELIADLSRHFWNVDGATVLMSINLPDGYSYYSAYPDMAAENPEDNKDLMRTIDEELA